MNEDADENLTQEQDQDDIVEPTVDTGALEAEIASLKDQLLRALAEQENIRRRTQREKEDALKYGASNFAKSLLSTADNLRRALESIKPEQVQDDVLKNLLTGVEATERELLSAFSQNGIKRVTPDGEKFDHNFHQAIFEVEHTGKPPGTVVQVLQPGYTLNDRLLRPAMVGVAKGAVIAEAAPLESVQHVDRTA